MSNNDYSTPQYKYCARGDACAHPDGPFLPMNSTYFGIHNRSKYGYRSECKECRRKDYQDHRQERLEYARKNYRDNPKKVSQICREYYRRNSKKRLEYQNQYNQNNRHITRIVHQRRRTRKKALPHNYSGSDWSRALEYFHGCCAVCGRQLNDLFGERTAAMDHWIPLASPDCPGTVPTNIVPLCHGVDGCNSKKYSSDPYEWLVREYGKRRANTIFKRVQSYFESLK